MADNISENSNKTPKLILTPDFDNPGDFVLEISDEFKKLYGFNNDLKIKIFRTYRNSIPQYHGRSFEPVDRVTGYYSTPEEVLSTLRTQIVHDLGVLIREVMKMEISYEES